MFSLSCYKTVVHVIIEGNFFVRSINRLPDSFINIKINAIKVIIRMLVCIYYYETKAKMCYVNYEIFLWKLLMDGKKLVWVWDWEWLTNYGLGRHIEGWIKMYWR